MAFRSKLVMAVATSLVGAAMLAGGTFALYTASTTNTPNTFTSGTVKINDFTGGSAFQQALYVTNLAPGDRENGTISIKNTGSLDAWVAIAGVDTSSGTAAQTLRQGPPDGHGPGSGGGDTPPAMTLFDGATPVQITWDHAALYIPAGQTKNFTVNYNFPSSAGNEYQGLSGAATFTIHAVQARNNTNSTWTGPLSWGS